jgi:hypothetical protein
MWAAVAGGEHHLFEFGPVLFPGAGHDVHILGNDLPALFPCELAQLVKLVSVFLLVGADSRVDSDRHSFVLRVASSDRFSTQLFSSVSH